MKKKGKTKQEILFEEKTKPFLNDYSIQVQDKIDRKKIKEEIRKIIEAAEQRINKLNAELTFVKELLRQEIEKRKQVLEILRKEDSLLSERVKEISCLVRHEAAKEMRAGPSEPACRSGLQTTLRCSGKEPGY